MKFTRPENLDCFKLADELKAVGIIVSGGTYENGKLVRDDRFHIDSENNLIFDVESGDESQVAEILAAHTG